MPFELASVIPSNPFVSNFGPDRPIIAVIMSTPDDWPWSMPDIPPMPPMPDMPPFPESHGFLSAIGGSFMTRTRLVVEAANASSSMSSTRIAPDKPDATCSAVTPCT